MEWNELPEFVTVNAVLREEEQVVADTPYDLVLVGIDCSASNDTEVAKVWLKSWAGIAATETDVKVLLLDVERTAGSLSAAAVPLQRNGLLQSLHTGGTGDDDATSHLSAIRKEAAASGVTLASLLQRQHKKLLQQQQQEKDPAAQKKKRREPTALSWKARFVLPERWTMNSTVIEECVAELATSLWLGLYRDERYTSKTQEDNGTTSHSWFHLRRPPPPPPTVQLDLIVPSPSSSQVTDELLQVSLHKAAVLARATYLSRDIVNAPHNVLNSVALADTAVRLAAKHHKSLSCKILSWKDCEAAGMGAFLGVARGSETPPQLIHLTYTGKRTSKQKKPPKKIGLIGKGLLMDTGGYSIKSTGMELMKFDCGGAAAVLGAAWAIAALQPADVEVHFVVAACENMINERAVVPGDVLTAANGKTIEVLNTDAEGRLTMADALVYVDKNLGCDEIVEMSTLTGACLVALGQSIAGLFTKNDNLAAAITEASELVQEPIWRMPLGESYYGEDIKSKIADIKNIGGKFGGAITAALFLHHFVNTDKPFVHLDMAGPVWNYKTGQATGYGARLLAEYICSSSRRTSEDDQS
jgi:leucyl aminopeptidase